MCDALDSEVWGRRLVTKAKSPTCPVGAAGGLAARLATVKLSVFGCAYRWVVTRVLFGWRELHPTVSAAAIAASTAAALRAPMVRMCGYAAWLSTSIAAITYH